MTDWQPIASAPKNCIVLVCDERRRVLAATWRHGNGWNTWLTEPGLWRLHPTHWQPIPDPPAPEPEP